MTRTPVKESFKYLAVWLICLAICGAIVHVTNGGFGARDHAYTMPSGHAGDWYLDLGGRWISEIQDQDMFLHNIGRSVEYLKKADVVMLGSSIASFAVDGDVIHEKIEKKYGLRFYNMAFVGVASGEFSRRVIEKYEIRPRLWVINADDGGGPSSFFSRNIIRAFSADVKPISATEHGRLKAYLEVVRRNLRWQMEDITNNFWPQFFENRPKNNSLIPRFYRNAATGQTDMQYFSGFMAEDNVPVNIGRDPDCHTNPETISIAREYIKSLGGAVILTLIPNMHYCAMQAQELADAIGVELALPGRTDYTSWDRGGHLDHLGAIRLTEDLVSAIEKSATFRRIGQRDD